MKKLYYVTVHVLVDNTLRYYKDIVISTESKEELQKQLLERLKHFFRSCTTFDCEIKIDDFNYPETGYFKVYNIYPAREINGYIGRFLEQYHRLFTVEL